MGGWGGRREHGKHHTRGFFTGSVSDGPETGVGVRAAGLGFADRVSITISGWNVWRVTVLTTLVTWKHEWGQLLISIRYKKFKKRKTTSTLLFQLSNGRK